MSLLVRINLILGAVSVCAAILASVWCWRILEVNARQQVLADAGLMMDSAIAIQSYTAEEILPLLERPMHEAFLPQGIPFYAATQNFLRLRERHPQYAYKEATLNPTNPRDRATDWEADLIQRFRNDAGTAEMVGERETPLGSSLYLARPIRVAAECVACHGSADAAPPTLVARYGRDNGFGWQTGETVGAHVVSVPFSAAAASAGRAFRGFLTALGATFATFFVALNVLLYVLLVRPVKQIAAIADRLSVGDQSAAQFPAGGPAEVASLVRSFNRMRTSLDKAMRLLGAS